MSLSKPIQMGFLDAVAVPQPMGNNFLDLFREHTPINEYEMGEHLVFVKREDMFGNYPAPPLAKLRGAKIVLLNLFNKGVCCVGSWDTRVSKLSQGISALCAALKIRHICAYPKLKDQTELPPAIQRCKELGSEVYPTPATRLNISFAYARKYVESQGGHMLPFGLQCDEAVFGVEREAQTVPRKYYENGSLVISVGSAVTLSGIIRGFDLLPAKIVAISAGRSIARIKSFMMKYLSFLPDNLEIKEALSRYDIEEMRPVPFPCHRNYDAKVWWWLNDNIETLPKPILFWNIGA